jgi:4-amino-4-deoxy-L-arabinose transferase-like glycosyltransferase
MRPNYVAWLAPALFTVWLFFVLTTFFMVQKPFVGAHALAAGRTILDLMVASWVVLVSLGLGLGLLRLLLPETLSRLKVTVLGTGLGLGLLGLLSLAIGLVGLFRPAITYSLMVVLSLGLLGWLWRQKPGWLPALIDPPRPWMILYLGFIALLTLLLALLPPADWDGLFYHLTGPKLYLQAGRITGGMDVPHFNFPSLMEMLFAWAMLLRGDVAAKLLHTSFALLLAGLVYLIARRWLDPKAGWPAVIILASMPLLVTLGSWAYNDLALAFYQLASVYSIINYQLAVNKEREAGIQTGSSLWRNRSWLILSGLFAGLAMGMKYTSFVTPLVVVLIIAYYVSRIAYYRVLFDLSIFSGAAFLVAFPWYLKNWMLTGNPVYPFLSGVFGGQFWDGFRAEWYAGAGTGIGWDPGKLLALPWLLTLGVYDANYWDGRTGPLWLLFLPLIIFLAWPGMRRRLELEVQPVALAALLVYSLAHFGFWALGVIWSQPLFQSRLLLPGLVGLVPLAGWAWLQLPKFDLPQFSVSRFVNIAVALTLVLTVIDLTLLTQEKIDPLPYLLGQESRETHLTRRLGAYYVAMQEINQKLPAEARIVFLGEPRSYYCQKDCRPDSILDEFPHLVYRYGTAEAIAKAWQAAGITHVLVYRAGVDLGLKGDPETVGQEVLSTLQEKYWREMIDVVGAYQVYELVGTDLQIERSVQP